ncbi:TadE/TadG family type IV pilus assembly protein [Pasteurella dagmatis]|nr:TadE/TadG family type IV pilus assembly protein [Pasteurella dagmatis]SNV62726.1 Flp pilus assembly protein TadG [Pasteurella dagmatis]
MKNFYWSTRCFQKLKDFYQEEKGVYAVMTALLSFPLLVLIAFTVDGTGIILDKVRLAQATDQAALLLVAENNAYRKNPMHDDVTKQSVSKEELSKFSGDKLSAQKDKRNQELIQGLAKMYLRSENKAQKDNHLPVTIDQPFDYKCEELDLINPKNQYSRRKPVTCYVQGSVNREFWIPLSADLVKTHTKNGRLPINSGISYAVKEKAIVIPVDLMLVSDFSGSMLWDLKNNENAQYPNRKIDILRSVVSDIQNILFPTKLSEDASPYNRMGFAAFAGGTRQRGDKNSCVMPYYLKSGVHDFRVAYWQLDSFNYRGSPWDCKDTNVLDDRGNPRPVNACLIKGNPEDALRTALNDRHLSTSMKLIFEDVLDVDKTIKQVENFDGNRVNDYKLTYNNPDHCLGGNEGVETSQAWFTKSKPKVAEALSKIKPTGSTAASSGFIIGANLLMDKNTVPEAQPAKLGTNTQRILMVLSDGEDNRPTFDTLTTLLNAGLCDNIRKKADSLQDPKFNTLPTKIAFAAFGFQPPPEQKAAWQKCVGENNYYEPSSKEALLDAFKQILSFEEEVGRSSIKKPTF